MADEQQSADDLRSILSASIEQSAVAAAAETPPAAKAEPPEKAEPEIKAEPKADAGEDRPRDASGKFVKKDGEAEGDDKPKAETDDKAKPEAKAKVETESKEKDKEPSDRAAATGKDAPANWSASDKAMFKLQSPEAQEFLLRRHKAMEADYTRKVQEHADLRKDYEPVQKLFAPYLDVLKQKGLTPHTVIQRWADVETKLANPQTRLDIIEGIVKGYNIDKADLAKRLGFTSTPSGQLGTEQNPGTPDDPTAQMLARLEQRIKDSFAPQLAKIDQFEQNQQIAAQRAATERESAVETKITNFKSAADKDGNLLHPYYDEVEPAMIALAQSYAASEQPLPELDALYDQAVWANPSTRQALLATQKTAQEAKAADEARAKAASARRAASSVTGSPGSGQATRPVRGDLSLREQLEEAAAENAA